MTDKEKIRKEVERLRNLHQMKYQQLDLDADSGLSLVECGKRNLCNELLSFIDSLQEEPLSRTPADIEAAMKEVEEKSRAFTEAHQGEDTDTILAQMQGEEPVSNDLEKAIEDAMPDCNWRIDDVGDEVYEDAYNSIQMANMFKTGAKWQKANLWKPADGDVLPEIDKEVIVLHGIKNPVTTDSVWGCEVAFAHRPNPTGWDGKSITTGKVEHYDVQTYGKGGWNIPDVKFWLDCELPKMEE